MGTYISPKVVKRQAIKDIQHQLDYVTKQRDQAQKDGHEAERFWEGMITAYEISISILKGEEL